MELPSSSTTIDPNTEVLSTSPGKHLSLILKDRSTLHGNSGHTSLRHPTSFLQEELRRLLRQWTSVGKDQRKVGDDRVRVGGQDVFTQISNGGEALFVGTSVVLSLASLVPLFKGVSLKPGLSRYANDPKGEHNYLLKTLGKKYSDTVGVVDLTWVVSATSPSSLSHRSATGLKSFSLSPFSPATVLSDTVLKLIETLLGLVCKIDRNPFGSMNGLISIFVIFISSVSYLNYGLLAARAEILGTSKDSENPCVMAGYHVVLGGTLDPQDASLWASKSSNSKNWPDGAMSLVISNSNNVVVN
ncbi:hypothetical protein L6452_02312 [Arctium lappa]|uniref:Uncharacterized protein n=1 Tax=Arctium lappa TaxID=4217 RepID=A0ACB9FJ69_ARCLA|nr:hypothetical protein L6452_02312 [Arctium lappa]